MRAIFRPFEMPNFRSLESLKVEPIKVNPSGGADCYRKSAFYRGRDTGTNSISALHSGIWKTRCLSTYGRCFSAFLPPFLSPFAFFPCPCVFVYARKPFDFNVENHLFGKVVRDWEILEITKRKLGERADHGSMRTTSVCCCFRNLFGKFLNGNERFCKFPQRVDRKTEKTF